MVFRKAWALLEHHLHRILDPTVVLLFLATRSAGDSSNHELVFNYVRWCIDSGNDLLRCPGTTPVYWSSHAGQERVGMLSCRGLVFRNLRSNHVM